MEKLVVSNLRQGKVDHLLPFPIPPSTCTMSCTYPVNADDWLIDSQL